jgi:DNA-binding CsgD family transcriptional regulator
MEAIDDFFIPENSVTGISEEDYKRAIPVVDALKAFARLTYQSVYIIDYYRKNFLYVSENPLFLCGMPPDEVREKGYSFYMEHVPKSEINMLLQINRAGFTFFNQTAIEDRIKLSISYDFHIRHKMGEILINHKLTPIMLSGNGNIWLAACVVSLSSRQQAGNIEAYMDGISGYWTYSPKNCKWDKKEDIALTNREKEVLLFSAQGLTMKEIADRLYISEDTVKFHRKSIFLKLGVTKIPESLFVAVEKQLI